MIRGPNRILTVLIALIVCGWLFIALVPDFSGKYSRLGSVVFAARLGTMYGQVSLAAAWCALGPFALIRRLPLSFAWIAAIVFSFGCYIARQSHSSGLSVLLVYGGTALGQWLLVQIPIWFLVARYGLRIVGANHQPANRELPDLQFGIRQVMILTALVAVVLGAGRMLLGGLISDQSFFLGWNAVMYFGLFALANVAIAFPFVAAPLIRRNRLLAMAGALLLAAVTTLIELSVLVWLEPFGPMNTDIYWTFALANAVQGACILTLLLLLRAAGFRLESRHAAVPASSEN